MVLPCLPSRCSASGSMRCGKTDALISSACAPAGARRLVAFPLAQGVDNGNNIRTWFDGSHWAGRSLPSVSANVPGFAPSAPTLADVAAPPEPVWSNHAGFGFSAPAGLSSPAAPAAAASRDRRLIPPPDAPAPGCPSAYPSATTCPRTRQSGGAASARPPWQSGSCCRARSRASCCRSA